jgi:hypothetical protein
MTIGEETGWKQEFGISVRRSDHFIQSKEDLTRPGSAVPQAHLVRRAFDLLGLDAVLCMDGAPLVYFRQLPKLETSKAVQLHRDFWNHGGAPLLVLITPSVVHIYSALARPTDQTNKAGELPTLVEKLDRASQALREFLPSVESGDFFRRHAQAFDPDQRVDRALLENLEATRVELIKATARQVDPDALDALLCRLVFTCYLFDRGVIDAAYLRGIGVPGAGHLRDVLSVKPRTVAKSHLYDRLFKKLAIDFNGDLFSDDLQAEAELIGAKQIELLEEFFRGTDIKRGQRSFWPYNFGVIPVETISAIYERFLKVADRAAGAFYTPRFLAEAVLDSALTSVPSLLGRRFLDPACGSGIFLVGLFNRIAEEWTQANPNARNDRRARELMELLRSSVAGVDISGTACRITAFSLYVAYLDQLEPRLIQELQAKGRALPRLVNCAATGENVGVEGNIWCGDFFVDDGRYPRDVDLVIGNPPWGSKVAAGTPAALWCREYSRPLPDKQIAFAFTWKAPEHVKEAGRVCLVLPHGTLFNHSPAAVGAQAALFKRHAVDRVLNLADYQRFLFDEAGHPAIVMSYRRRAPKDAHHSIEYWAPKANWMITRAEVMIIAAEDRSTLSVQDILADLAAEDAPQIWKRNFWATPRDWRLIDRLASYPRLRDRVRRAKERNGEKPWLMAEGFQPLGKKDDPAKALGLLLPSNLFIKARSKALNLFLLSTDCAELPVAGVMVRSRSNRRSGVFNAPHVLVTQGFSSIAYSDFAVSFQHALRGIVGREKDHDLLAFLAAYLRTPLARYFLFHTSSNWGVNRQKVHVDEVLRLPFPVPEMTENPGRSRAIVEEVAGIVMGAAEAAKGTWVDRKGLIRSASEKIEPLVGEYFDVTPGEMLLVRDTIRVVIPSVRPTRKRLAVPTIVETDDKQRNGYTARLCETLNGWTKRGGFVVQGNQAGSSKLGVGVAVIERSLRAEGKVPPEAPGDLLATMDRLRAGVTRKLNAFELARGVKAFDGERLYVVKPIARRFWTDTAALNDADEIAGSILMQVPEGVA